MNYTLRADIFPSSKRAQQMAMKTVKQLPGVEYTRGESGAIFLSMHVNGDGREYEAMIKKLTGVQSYVYYEPCVNRLF
ncbi:MAG: hypothetical protein V1870_00265 [Candidatus Aenigmatarchaeota archaeon]